MRRVVAILVLLVLASCDGASLGKNEKDAVIREAFVGFWYGTYELENVTIHFIVDHSRSGQYAIKYKEWHPDGTIKTYGEAGKWLITDGLFKVQKEFIGEERVAANDMSGMFTYRVENFSSNEISYRLALNPTFAFTARRVDASFALP